MSTELGNTTKTFGKEYNISKSNLGGDIILQSTALRENTIIIDSKIDENLEDVGSYSIFMTDNNGKAVRLTYTLQEGNGLHYGYTTYNDGNSSYVEYDSDVLRMVIDEDSIMDDQELYVNKTNIIDNHTLLVTVQDTTAKRGRIHVQTSNLDYATAVSYGITKGDENTTYIDTDNPGQIKVNTQNLDTVDDASNRDGIVKHNSEMANSTIAADNGKLKVVTKYLDKSTYNDFGISIGDNETITANDGVLSVITAGLEHATNNKYGTVKGDSKTVSANDGILTVNTRNLEPATAYDYGVVMFDDWSIGVSDINNKLEVKRYPEIEALLNTNNPEHEIFRADIEDLKNRVSKLETMALQEVIEFLIPVGDPTTELPEPEFDKETWSIKTKYADKKTISFHVKSNCKFYVNVDFKKGTNNYGQVTLLNVQEGSGAAIPANNLANTIFEATGNTVQTLYFTFNVKNYEEESNQASINTHVIVTAASINDAAIHQTSFHIFKCWNNRAYEEDKPNFEEPDIKVIEENSYWVMHTGSEYLTLHGNTTQTSEVNHNSTSSKNFYFHTYTLGTYYTMHSDGSVTTDGPNKIEQSSTTGNGPYDVKVFTSSSNSLNASETNTDPNFTATITATYNSTKNYNVITVKSVNPLTVSSRNTYIHVKLPNTSNTAQTVSTLSQISASNTDEVITAFNSVLDNQLTESNINSKFSKTKFITENANKKIATINTASSIGLNKILTDDINVYKQAVADLNSLKTKPEYNKGNIVDKSTYLSYVTYTSIINEYSNKIINEYNTFATNESGVTFDNEKKHLVFEYKENVKAAAPVLNTTLTLTTNGTVFYDITRNFNSYVIDQNYGIDIKYSFINKDGSVVDEYGNSTTKIYSLPRIYPGNAIAIKSNYTSNELTMAATGTTSTVTTEEIPYRVVIISAGKNDRKSLWGIGSGHKDEGIAYWGSYDPALNTTLSAITDDIYLVFQLSGQDARWGSGQNYSFYGINLKNKQNGYTEEFEQANDIDVVGITTNPIGKKSRTAPGLVTNYIDSAKTHTRYVLKRYADDQLHPSVIHNNYASGSATAEKSVLNQTAKEYYNANRSVITKYTNEIPAKIPTNIVGIKINSVNIIPSAETVFVNGDKLVSTYKVTGVWNNNGSTSSSNSTVMPGKNYQFGNAKLTGIYIYSWDDLSMKISFNLMGGNTTNIPDGTKLELHSTTDAETKFTFLQGSKSYPSEFFYESIEFDGGSWYNNSCTATFTLKNNYSLNYTGMNTIKTTVYDKTAARLNTVYMSAPIKYTEVYGNGRDTAQVAVPLLTDISGIKFWIGFDADEINSNDKFLATKSSMGIQVNMSGPYASGAMKTLSIANAVYTN